MREYALYLESGPKRRKTMVHVPELLGCIAQGATTEAALEATPKAIRIYLRFLQRHGEAVNPDEAFSTTIVEHVMKGCLLGNGDPTPGFQTDFQPAPALEGGFPLDMIEMDIKNAWQFIGEITGETATEDLLDHIFSKFCFFKNKKPVFQNDIRKQGKGF